MGMEQWKIIEKLKKPGAEYWASSFGRIKIIRNGKERCTYGYLDDKGYRQIKHTKWKSASKVHQLILESFCEKPDWAQCINHKNCIRDDNRLENLEWATFKMNTNHAYQNGRIIQPNGENHFRSIPIELVHKIYAMKKEGIKKRGIIKTLKMRPSTMYGIYHGVCWKYEYKKYFS